MRNYHLYWNLNGRGNCFRLSLHSHSIDSFRTNANRIYGRNLLGPSQTVSHYPQTPPAGGDTPEFYYRLAPDTLFFVFYYMEVLIITMKKKQFDLSFSFPFSPSRELVRNI